MKFFKKFLHIEYEAPYNAQIPKKESENDPHIRPSDALKRFERLEETEDGYFITRKVPYQIDGRLKPKTISTVFDFSYNMTFGGKGEHRSYRSGGAHKRKNGEIFANTF